MIYPKKLGFMLVLVHYVPQMFRFDTLSFKSFIWIFCVFEMYYFDHYFNFLLETLLFC